MNLGENIYRYRTQKNMSQGDLADALDISRQSVSKWENNSAVPELDKLMKMAEIFDVSMDELITGSVKAAPTMTTPTTPTDRFSSQKIIGCFCLGLGLLFTVACLILAIVLGNNYENDLMMAAFLIGLPMTVIGIACLLVKKHAALVCAWLIYLPLWGICLINTSDSNLFLGEPTIFTILYLCTLAYETALSAFTLVNLWKNKIQTHLIIKILITILVGVMLVISATGLLPPETGNVEVFDEVITVIPQD